MNLLPKTREKRTQLYFTLAAVVLAVVGLGFFVIRPQYQKLAIIRNETAETEGKWQDEKKVIKESASSTSDLAKLDQELLTNEQDMASGDIYAWTLDTIRHFKEGHKVDVPEIGQPTVGQMDLLPNFPYQQLRFTIHGAGYYHDIGRFIADFENRYPHMRVVDLVMDPIGGGDSEKLAFSMDIVALIKSGP